jgi:hypothetical protein
VFHDKGKSTLPHLQRDAGCIKSSADAMHNGQAITKIQQLPPHFRRNLVSHLQRASMCQAELIPTDKQIPPATMHDATTFSSTNAEGGGFCATAEEVHATRTKEKEMVREHLNGWQKGAHGYIPEVKDNNIIHLGCENVNSLSIFHPTKSKMCKLTHLHQRHQTGGACIVEHAMNPSDGTKKQPPGGPIPGNVQ